MKVAKDIFKSLSAVTWLMFVASLCFSCSDEDPDVPPVEETPLELSEQQVEISSDGRYYSITMGISDGDYSLQDIRATTDADWIRLEADTISRDGRLTFHVEPNTGARSRDGIITLHLQPSTFHLQPSTLTVHQRSEAEDDSNALNGDSITRKARVGYGYDMLIDYMNPECVTEPIIDYEKLVQAEQTWGTIIAEEGRAEQSLSYHSSYSIEEMSSWMSKQTTTEVDFLFVNKSVNKFQKTSEYDLNQQTFGYSSLSKVVATRYLDEGKVQSIIRQGHDIFTKEFREIYDQVNSNPTVDSVRSLVQRFGTHLVTYADLGGRLDYSVNFQSDETSRESVEKYLKYKNGKQKENKESKEASHAIISSGGLHFDIYGGTEAAIKKLRNNANTKDRYGQVDPGVLGEWLNSIKTSNPQSISLVRCILQPIWQLFTNQQARVEIINHILALAYSEAGQVGTRLQELGLDNYYQLNVTKEMQQFGSDVNSSLAKIIYYDGLPKVEVCNEYVPELRGDRRVTIFYPIFRGKTNIRRGIFLGDGENAPAEVTFDNEGGCYVRPLEKYHPGDRLTTLYYVDGAFYPTSIGIKIPPYKMTVKDEWLNLFKHTGADGNGNYPVVKIGPGFWTRTYVTDEVGFEDDLGNPAEDVYPVGSKKVLFADVFHHVNSDAVNIANFTVNDQNHWYLPTSNDLNALMQYVGKNPKTLFKNQMSGFDADFCGYVVRQDLLTGQIPEDIDIGYVNELCVIAFHDDASNGTALLIKPDYTWQAAKISKTYRNRYPIRPFRNKTFIHQNK